MMRYLDHGLAEEVGLESYRCLKLHETLEKDCDRMLELGSQFVVRSARDEEINLGIGHEETLLIACP